MRLADKGYISPAVLSPDLLTRSSGQRLRKQCLSSRFSYFASLLNRGSCIYFDSLVFHSHCFNLMPLGEAWAKRRPRLSKERACRSFLAAISCLPLLKPRWSIIEGRIPACGRQRCKLIAGRLVEMKGCVGHAPLAMPTGRLGLELGSSCFSGFRLLLVRTGSGRPRSYVVSSQ